MVCACLELRPAGSREREHEREKVRRLHRARIKTGNHEVGRGPLWRRFQLRFIAHRLREFRHIRQDHAPRNPGFSQYLCGREQSVHFAQRVCASACKAPSLLPGKVILAENIPKALKAFVPTSNHATYLYWSEVVEMVGDQLRSHIMQVQYKFSFQASCITFYLQ